MIDADEQHASSLHDELPHTQSRARENAAKRFLDIAERTGFGMGRIDETAARHIVELIAVTQIERGPRSGKEEMEMTELLRSTQTDITEMRKRLDGLLSELTCAADSARDSYLELYDKATDIEDTQLEIALNHAAKRAIAIKKLHKSIVGIAKAVAKGNREIEDCRTEWTN